MSSRSTLSQFIALGGCLMAAFAAGALGAIASIDARAFYAELSKPAWAPPGAVFGPVWTVLYALMGVAAWLVWRLPRPRGLAMTLFFAQLVANALWSWLFFAWKLGAAASIEVLVLWALIVATTVVFWRARRAAGVLLLPYLAWVSFASALTWAVWQRNPQLL